MSHSLRSSRRLFLRCVFLHFIRLRIRQASSVVSPVSVTCTKSYHTYISISILVSSICVHPVQRCLLVRQVQHVFNWLRIIKINNYLTAIILRIDIISTSNVQYILWLLKSGPRRGSDKVIPANQNTMI